VGHQGDVGGGREGVHLGTSTWQCFLRHLPLSVCSLIHLQSITLPAPTIVPCKRTNNHSLSPSYIAFSPKVNPYKEEKARKKSEVMRIQVRNNNNNNKINKFRDNIEMTCANKRDSSFSHRRHSSIDTIEE